MNYSVFDNSNVLIHTIGRWSVCKYTNCCIAFYNGERPLLPSTLNLIQKYGSWLLRASIIWRYNCFRIWNLCWNWLSMYTKFSEKLSFNKRLYPSSQLWFMILLLCLGRLLFSVTHSNPHIYVLILKEIIKKKLNLIQV